MINIALAAACVALCLFAAIKDIQTLTIPNWVNASIAGLGVAALAVSGLGLETIGWHLLCGAVGLIICMALFFIGAFGGGDAKMIPAALIWVGPSGAAPFLLGTAVVGGALALVLLPARAAAPEGFAGPRRWASLQSGAGAPYAVAITAGVFFAFQASPLLSVLTGRII